MKHPLFAAVLASLVTLPAHAVLVTDAAAIPGPASVVDFEAFDGLLTSGPVALNSEVIFTGDSQAELGANNRDLGDNGVWGVGNFFAAGGVSGELRFTFADDRVSAAAGAFVSHAAYDGFPLVLAVEVSAYGANNLIIETHSFVVDKSVTDYNEGQFLGITRGSADIRSISFKGVGVVADNLTYTAPVPEPETYALLLAGLAVVGRLARRRRS